MLPSGDSQKNHPAGLAVGGERVVSGICDPGFRPLPASGRWSSRFGRLPDAVESGGYEALAPAPSCSSFNKQVWAREGKLILPIHQPARGPQRLALPERARGQSAWRERATRLRHPWLTPVKAGAPAANGERSMDRNLIPSALPPLPRPPFRPGPPRSKHPGPCFPRAPYVPRCSQAVAPPVATLRVEPAC